MFYKNTYPSREEINKRFDFINGLLYHKKATSNRIKAGDVAGSVALNGGVGITIDSIRYSERVLIDILTNDNHIKMTGK